MSTNCITWVVFGGGYKNQTCAAGVKFRSAIITPNPYYSMPNSIYLVENSGIEPLSSHCKCAVLPTITNSPFYYYHHQPNKIGNGWNSYPTCTLVNASFPGATSPAVALIFLAFRAAVTYARALPFLGDLLG